MAGACGACGARAGRLGRDLERLERFRVMDDTFMRQVFRDNLPLAQRVLRVLTGVGDLVLTREETQRDLKRVAGSRSVVLDVYGRGAGGEQYDLEVQTGGGVEPRRLRYYGSAMDVDSLGPGRPYSELPERWVVAVVERDPEGPGRALRRYEMRERGGGVLGDGAHLVCANASYRGDDELGSLMADFCQSDPDRISDPLLRERVQYLKRDPEGVARMCRISEEIYNEGVEQGREQGLAQGREQGLAQGREQGLAQGVVEHARSLVSKMGVDAAEALRLLGVPESKAGKYLALI